LAVPLALALGSMPALERAAAADGIPIRHVIIIMQENRSFDSYFGTFPVPRAFPPAHASPSIRANRTLNASGRSMIPMMRMPEGRTGL